MVRFGVAQLADQAVNFQANLRIEAGGGLVEKHQVRIVDQRQGQRDALLLSAGKRRNRRRRAFLQAAGGRSGCRDAACRRIERRRACERLAHRDFVGQIGGLQAHADAVLERLYVDCRDRVRARFTSPAVRGAQAFQNLDGGGFPRAVRPEQAEDFARATSKSMPRTASNVSVGLPETLNLNRAGHAPFYRHVLARHAETGERRKLGGG